MPKILLVDDDKLMIEIFTLTLQRRGFDIRAAFNGQEALALASIDKPDVILLDLKMPGPISANEVCTRIRASPGDCPIPVLVVSAQSDFVVRTAVPDATAYVHKPVDLPALSALVAKVIEQRCDEGAPEKSHPEAGFC